jgi:Cys-rich repeat protein
LLADGVCVTTESRSEYPISPGCTSNDDCSDGYTCDIGSSTCVTPASEPVDPTPPGCTSNSDCAQGETCDVGSGTCVASTPSPSGPDLNPIPDGEGNQSTTVGDISSLTQEQFEGKKDDTANSYGLIIKLDF